MANIKEIKEMISLMNENNLSEIEIEKDGQKIKLKRVTGQAVSNVETSAPISIEQAAVKFQDETKIKEEKYEQIKSPMVGTFYRAPSPDTPPFVDAGEKIEVGQIVCIIEAMKLMNEIKTEIKGKIVEMLVENGRPVEFGQPLFLIEPA
ncbi:MAG: acetyl-CoA carboxylase biotin carboxyl carrier protein [Candidatus Gygaella obscura]|nr:acetyl-CoA carboxylase biotin carboxyl carrier protein [Candidatus Gygaella obscura]